MGLTEVKPALSLGFRTGKNLILQPGQDPVWFAGSPVCLLLLQLLRAAQQLCKGVLPSEGESLGLNRGCNAIFKGPTQTDGIVQEEQQFITLSGLSCTQGKTLKPNQTSVEKSLTSTPIPLHFSLPEAPSPRQGGAYHEPDGERHLLEDVGAVGGDRGDAGAPQDGEQPGLVHRVQVHTQVGHGVVPAKAHTG